MPRKIVRDLRNPSNTKRVLKGLTAARDCALTTDIVAAAIKLLDSGTVPVYAAALAFLRYAVNKTPDVAIDCDIIPAIVALPHTRPCIDASVAILRILSMAGQSVADAINVLCAAIVNNVSSIAALGIVCGIASSSMSLVIETFDIADICKYFMADGLALGCSLMLASGMCTNVRYLGSEIIAFGVVDRLVQLVAERKAIACVTSLVGCLCSVGYTAQVLPVLTALLAAVGDTSHDVLRQKTTSEEEIRELILESFIEAMRDEYKVVCHIDTCSLFAACISPIDKIGIATIDALLTACRKHYNTPHNPMLDNLQRAHLPKILEDLPEADRLCTTWFPTKS